MNLPTFSPDQAEAWDSLSEVLESAGIDLTAEDIRPPQPGKGRVMAVIGKAGSGKTMILAALTKALREAGLDIISGDYEGKKRKERRTVAVLAPTNKAAFVLRMRGVPATTIHRILYTPVYDPEYEKIADWLTGSGERPKVEGLTDAALDRAKAFYDLHAAIRYWPVRVGGQSVLLLGPIAVHPTAQGEGLGGWLMQESLHRAGLNGWARVMLVGDAPYYSRFGFTRLDDVEMPPPTNPDRVLGLELQPGAWADVRGKVMRETDPGIALAHEDQSGRPDCQPADLSKE